MPKIALYVGVGAGCVFLLALAFLAKLNWSPKVYGPLITIGLGAAGALVFALSTVLKPTHLERHFATSIALDENNLPVAISSDFTDNAFVQSELLWFRTEEDGSGNPLRRKPRQIAFAGFNEKSVFYAEYFQLLFIEQMEFMRPLRPFDPGSTNGRAVTQAVVYQINKPKHGYDLAGSKIIALLSNNRFMERWKQRYWSLPKMAVALPIGASMSCADPYSVVIARPNYYRILFSVSVMGGGGGIPVHLSRFVPAAVGKIETLSFRVNLEADFDALTAENADLLDAKVWTEVLFRELEKRMANPPVQNE